MADKKGACATWYRLVTGLGYRCARLQLSIATEGG
jgi:hypothetical protein